MSKYISQIKTKERFYNEYGEYPKSKISVQQLSSVIENLDLFVKDLVQMNNKVGSPMIPGKTIDFLQILADELSYAHRKNGLKTCFECGSLFKAKRRDAIYCSSKCRQRRYKYLHPLKGRILFLDRLPNV